MLSMQGASYRYPSGAQVGPVDLEVAPGELVLLTGPTGCGKSTLLRLAAGLAGRHGRGEAGGLVRVGGDDPSAIPPGVRVGRVGLVSQDPDDQLCTATLGDEVAFGPQSAGWSRDRVQARVAELLDALGLPPEPDRDVRALSGGQRQRLAVAAALAAGAGLLLLDEPLAWLDPAGADALVGHLRRLADAGVAVLVVEHRLEALLSAADRVVLLEAGQVQGEWPASRVPVDRLRSSGLEVPGWLDLWDRAGRLGLGEAELAARGRSLRVAPPRLGEEGVRATGLRFAYGEREALRGVDLVVRRGERVAVLGANGSGKSTLLQVLAGWLPAPGVQVGGRVVDVPQDPGLALFCGTVNDELAYGPREAGLSEDEVERRVAAAAAALSVQVLGSRPPQALSRGQRLRVAVAAALACSPDLLLLDEPTAGQDRARVEAMMAGLAPALAEAALVFATHDVDLALRSATRLVVLDEGRVVLDAAPDEALRALTRWVRLPRLAAWCREVGAPPCTAAELLGEAPWTRG